jgi:hypothetical protein
MKKLIYFSLGNSKNYINLAKLCIDSLYRQNYDGDILFITDMEPDFIASHVKTPTTPLFLQTPQSTLADSSSNKLKIHYYPDIENKYEKFIYCDIDIIWLKSPDNIFNVIQNDIFYMSNELDQCIRFKDLMTNPFFGGNLLSQEDHRIINEQNIYGLNAGFFALNSSMIKHIRAMDNILSNNPSLMNACLEQPLFNAYIYKNQIYSNELNQFICHDGYNVARYDGVVLHFAGGPGNYNQKFQKMMEYINENFQ